MQYLSTTSFLSTTACALAASGCFGSNVASGPYDLFPPISSDVSASAEHASLPSHATASADTPDVIIISGAQPSCTVNESDMRVRANALLRPAIDQGFGKFPIDRERYRTSLSRRFFTKDAICAAFMRKTGATGKNHNTLRDYYRQNTISEQDAAKRGLIAHRLPVRTSCPPDDWASSPVYNGANDCEDITSKIGPGVPTAIYAFPVPPKVVKRYFTHPSAPALYTRYANNGPVMCDGYTKEVSDSFHSIYVSPVWPDLHYIMRTWETDSWSAWNLRRSCTINGKTYAYDDLMFNFGMRAFMPVTVEVNGETKAMTLVISGVAAASNASVAGIIPVTSFIPDDLPYERWMGGELAKKLLGEAWDNGWDVR